MSDHFTKLAYFGQSMVKVHPDHPPQVSYDKGETWEELKIDDIEEPVLFHQPRFVMHNIPGKIS